MVRRAHKWPAFNVSEPHVLPHSVELGKGVWMHEFRDRQMLGCWLQILSKRHNLTSDSTQIFHGLNHLVVRLTQTEHDPAFAPNSSIGEPLDDFEAAIVFGLDAHRLGHATHRFEVVRNHLRSHLNGPKSQPLRLADRLCPQM